MRQLLCPALLFAALAGSPLTPAHSAPASAPASPAPTAFPIHSPAEMIEDLNLLRTAFEEAHPSLYRYRSKPVIDAAFDRAEARLNRRMSSIEFFRIVAPVIAAVRDGHTTVRLSEAEDNGFRSTAPLLPLRFHVAKGRLWILRDLRGEATAPVIEGREVISIQGRPAGAVLAEMNDMIEGDGSIGSSRAAQLRSFRFNRLYGLLYGPSPNYRIKVRGVRRDIRMPGLTSAALTSEWDRRFPEEGSRKPAELVLRGDGIAVLTIRTFAGNADLEGKQRLDAFLSEAFARIETAGAKKLVIDLRGNGGGRDELGRILCSYLIDRAFTYYRGLYINRRDISFAAHVARWPGPVPDTIAAVDENGRLHLIDHPNLGTHQPNPHRFGGRTFILMDGASFSTTAEFLSLAHHHRLATFIGEESGGGYYGDSGGVVLDLTLPNSKLRVRLPMVRYEVAVEGFSPRDGGVPPDHRIEPSVADLLAGRDRAMDKALALARPR